MDYGEEFNALVGGGIGTGHLTLTKNPEIKERLFYLSKTFGSLSEGAPAKPVEEG